VSHCTIERATHALRLIVAEDSPALREALDRAPGSVGGRAVDISSAEDATAPIVVTAHRPKNARGRGLVLRSSPAARLTEALQVVANGGDYVDPAIEGQADGDLDLVRLASLSKRESEVLALLSEGLSGQGVADRLFLSPETVRTHVRNAMTKLGARTRVQAVAMLVRNPGTGRAPVRDVRA
jgi:DNA-binding CsgD family transcriptional regulator